MQNPVADLIFQLMSNNRMPMKPSAGLERYLMEASNGNGPPPISQDPAFEDPDFGLSAVDVMPKANRQMAAEVTGDLFLWIVQPKTGKKVRLDGPFKTELEASRAKKELETLSGSKQAAITIGPME